MQLIRDHGTEAKLQRNSAGISASPAADANVQLAASSHPVLIALVRLMAREAAAELLAVSGGTSTLSDTLDGQESTASKT